MSRNRVDCTESIEFLEYALDIMEIKIKSLKDSVNDIINTEPTLILIQNFYREFQETNDLYLFTYLGHFLRKEHHVQQPYVRNKNLLDYKVIQDGKAKFCNQDYFWIHCASSYLTKVL